jgi:CheY-like chemotaxis protein
MNRQTILIVDDDPSIRTVLSDFLGSRGYGVRAAGSGTDGLERFQHEAFDAVVTDMKMPGMSGMISCGASRKQPHVPVVVLRATDGQHRVEAMKEGAKFSSEARLHGSYGSGCKKGAGRKGTGSRGKRSAAPAGPPSARLPVGGGKSVTGDPGMMNLIETIEKKSHEAGKSSHTRE